MSAYKQFLTSDIIVTPFEVNKSFTFTGDALTGSNVGIDRFLGLNTSSLFDPLTDPTTGQNGTQYQRLIYNSIKELYYSNYLNGLINYGLPPSTASLIPGSDPSGDVYIGPTSSAGRYWNYPQTTLTFQHYFPTSSDSIIGVLSIPSGLFGSYIQPGSFIWTADSGSIYDDGQGNLLFSGTDDICGNIFYAHGIAVITTCSFDGASLYGGAIYGTSIYGATTGVILNMVTSSNITCSFSSSLTIYETQYKCTISENEFNFSQNPSILSGSSDEFLYDFATGSYFNPYVTTVGLYNENQDLIAVGKLAQPLITSNTTDTTILVNIDR
jgi:hypothetical protein